MSPGVREIPLAPLREAFLASGLTLSEVARRLDWFRGDHPTIADTSRVSRQLGITPQNFGRGYGKRYRQTTSPERATAIARAIGIDPVDLDL